MKRLLRLVVLWALVWPLVMGIVLFLDAIEVATSFLGRTLMLSVILVPTINLMVGPLAVRLTDRLTAGR